MKSFLVYKFTCASLSSSYVSKICRHFKSRIEEHIKKKNNSDIFKHLHSNATFFDSYNSLCFKKIDKVNLKLELKIKETLDIFVFDFLSSITLVISLALIIDVLSCLNYTSLLLHLITTHQVSHLSLLSIVFNISTLIINIFYCLN